MNNSTLGNIFKGDKVIWMIFFFLAIISLIEVYSASSQLTYKGGNYLGPILKHASILFLGLVAMVLTVQVKPKYFKVATPFMLLLSLILLIWAFFSGQSTNDASRWVGLGFFTFQPSEIAKGALVLATAQILSAMQTDNGADKRAMHYILVVCAFIIPPIMLENLSTAMLISVVIFMMMLIGRVPMVQLGKLMGVCILFVVFVIGMVMIFGHDTRLEEKQAQQTELVENVNGQEQTLDASESLAPKKKKGVNSLFHRFDTWKMRILKFTEPKGNLRPEDIDLDKDAQVAHANIAIATSHISGKGPGNSVERDFLSQAFSDFIYAIIIEELGIVGAFVIALLYIILLFRAGRIAHFCENAFPAYLVMGLALLLVTQALFNMCVAVGLAPVTGQPLPLVSKGGTSSIINCVYLGVMLSISRYAKRRNNNKEVETSVSYEE